MICLFVRDDRVKFFRNKDFEKILNSFNKMFSICNEDPNYKNLEYFDHLPFSGNNVYGD